jgi:hypothetical protein
LVKLNQNIGFRKNVRNYPEVKEIA